MKRITQIPKIAVILSVLIVCCNSLSSNIRLVNKSLIDENLPILYQYTENQICVQGLGNLKDIELKSSNGSEVNIVLSKNGEFSVKPKHLGWDTLFLYSKKKLLIQQVFEVNVLLDIQVGLGKIRDTIATVQEILDNAYLNVYQSEGYYKLPPEQFYFDSFVVTYQPKSDPSLFHEYSSENWTDETRKGKLNAQMLEVIKNAQSGDIIYFEKITLGCISSTSRKMQGFKVIIQ